MIRKRLAACLVFFVLAAGILYRVNDIFRLKGVSDGYPMQMFYQQGENTIDVLNIGSSHMYTSANPAVLWEEYGIASYNLGASIQPLWNSYYYLKEALKYQTPKLVILDVFGATLTEDYQTTARAVMNTTGLRLSEERIENIKASTPYESEQTDLILGYPVYHSRYGELTKEDFLVYNGDANGPDYKGFALNCISTTPIGEFTDLSHITEVKNLTEKCEEYLIKTVELAKDENIPILLIAVPYSGVTYEEKKVYNRVEQLAEEYGVPFIDFNEQCREIGLDPMNDFAESHHFNYYGSEKFSKYIGAYIIQHYDIPNHKGDTAYASWEQNSGFYKRQAENVDLMKTTDASEYLEKMLSYQERYTICLSLDGNYYSDDSAFLYRLSDAGLDVWNENIWVIKNGQILYHADKRRLPEFFYEDLGKQAAAVLDGTISMGEIEGDLVKDGLNILIYDNELETLVDSAAIDAAEINVILRKQ